MTPVYLDIAAALSLALLTGTEFAVSAFVNPVLWRLDDRSQSLAVKAFADKLGSAMPPWYGANLLLLIIETVLRRHHPGGIFFLWSCILWALVILFTVLFLVPLNNRLRQMQTHLLSAADRQTHRKWDARHRLRVAVLILACILFLYGIAANAGLA